MESRSTVEAVNSKASDMSEAEHHPVVATLATRMRSARKGFKWSQQGLATRAGTTQAVIQKIENGKSLRPRNIVRIAEALEVEPSWLMFGASETAEISPEAIAVAKAWSELNEPDRRNVKEQLMQLSRSL
ncbi:MAG: helix-turn-helix domain-containing protein [Gammaproteobacteria bacterium]|nr:helix-turn-helix domain-containing protein [Gammaproteobacteria bacterium]MDH3412688.1 helix-turn-helix domain-containing protein [Gammaproteobacteria bacterium]